MSVPSDIDTAELDQHLAARPARLNGQWTIADWKVFIALSASLASAIALLLQVAP